MRSSSRRQRRGETEVGGAASMSTLKRLLSDLLDTLQVRHGPVTIVIVITSAEEEGYVFSSVCLSVCLFVCLSVGLLANL